MDLKAKLKAAWEITWPPHFIQECRRQLEEVKTGAFQAPRDLPTPPSMRLLEGEPGWSYSCFFSFTHRNLLLGWAFVFRLC